MAKAAVVLPEYPVSWYFVCRLKTLTNGPVRRIVGGREYVAFRTSAGQVGVLDGRCPHMQASLGLGKVVDGCIQCPLHGWSFDVTGACKKIPAQTDIPAGIGVRSYPVEIRHGNVFFFNQEEMLFPLPFYQDASTAEFLSSTPFTTIVECPWHVISSNFFDEQHFRTAHDRRMSDLSPVTHPHKFARRAIGTFDVVGQSLRDRLWRTFLGPAVTLDHTGWMGTFSCTEARFAKTTSYGMISLNPMPDNKTELTLFACIKRKKSPLSAPFAAMEAETRKYCIANFLADDWQVLKGVSYSEAMHIAADQRVKEYIAWLADVTIPCVWNKRSRDCENLTGIQQVC